MARILLFIAFHKGNKKKKKVVPSAYYTKDVILKEWTDSKQYANISSEISLKLQALNDTGHFTKQS